MALLDVWPRRCRGEWCRARRRAALLWLITMALLGVGAGAARGRDRGAAVMPVATTTCPCRLAVPLDYSARDRQQAEVALRLIEELGEWIVLRISARQFLVSRHCIALHGVLASAIDEYGFKEIT